MQFCQYENLFLPNRFCDQAKDCRCELWRACLFIANWKMFNDHENGSVVDMTMLAEGVLHSDSFDEFYCCLKSHTFRKKLVKSWQCNIKEKYSAFIWRVFWLLANVEWLKNSSKLPLCAAGVDKTHEIWANFWSYIHRAVESYVRYISPGVVGVYISHHHPPLYYWIHELSLD